MNDRRALEALIDRLVQSQNFPHKPVLNVKIALLSFVLEQLKHERRIPDDLVSFEEFTQCRVFTDSDKLVIAAPRAFEDRGTGTTSIQLQAPLLLFLLAHHRDRYPVLEIIRLFIEKTRENLTYLDFKKTKTGVTRCYTNTRFAAKVLRAYGLLKFSQREAYKTWELSLTGFLVAADIYRKRCASADPWSVPSLQKEQNFDLLPEIRLACSSISSFPIFVDRLASICKPDTEVFKTFKHALQEAYGLLGDYWATINNSKMSQVTRQKTSLEFVNRLEEEGIDDGFYKEFSRCIQINELLATIPPPESELFE